MSPAQSAVSAEVLAAVAAALSGHDGAVRLHLRVQPGARRSGLVGVWKQRLRLAVAAPPVDGKANEAVERAVAELCDLPRRDVELVAGISSRDKTVAVAAPLAAVRTALERALAEALPG